MRNWKLQQMDRDMEATNEEEYEADYTEFLEDLEEDKAYRSHVNIYHGEGGGRCVLYDHYLDAASTNDVPMQIVFEIRIIM